MFVEMRRTDIREHAALPDILVPEGGGRGFASAGSLLHGAGNNQMTSRAGQNDRPGVVAIVNAALYHVGGFRRQVDETFKEWKDIHDFAEGAILAEKESLEWKSFACKPTKGNAAKRSNEAEKEILCRAALTLHAKLSQHFVPLKDTKSDVDEAEEHLQSDDDNMDADADARKVRTLVLSLIHI